MICSGCQRAACPIDNYNFKTCNNGHTFCTNCCSDTLNYCPICLTKIDNQQYKFFYENPPRIVQIHLPIENDENQSDYSDYFNRKIINDNDDGDYDTESEIKSIKCRQRNINNNVNDCNYNQNSYMPTLTESDINIHSSVKSCDSCEESSVTIEDFQKLQKYIDNASKNNLLPIETKPISVVVKKTSSRNIRRFKSEHVVDETNDLIPREDPKELYYQKQKGTLPPNFDPRAHYYKLFNELNNIQNIYNNKKMQQQQQQQIKTKLRTNDFGDININTNVNDNKKLSKPILEHLIEYRNSSDYKIPTVINVTKIDSNTILTDSDSFLTTSNCENKQHNKINTNSSNNDNIELLWRKNKSLNTPLNEKSTENANIYMKNKVSNKGNYDLENSSTDNSCHASQMATLINNAAFLLTKREYDFINNNNNSIKNNNKNNNSSNINDNLMMNDHEIYEKSINNNYIKDVIEDKSRDVFVSTESYPKLNPHLSYVHPKNSTNNLNPDKSIQNSWSEETHNKILDDLKFIETDNKKLLKLSTPTESLGKTISYSYGSSPSAPISLTTVQNNIDEENHISTDISQEKLLNINKISNKRETQQPVKKFSFHNNNVKIAQNLIQNNNNIENLKKIQISNENLLKNKDFFFNENYENLNKNQKKIVTKLIMSNNNNISKNNNNQNEINVIENVGDNDCNGGLITGTIQATVSTNNNETASNDVFPTKNYFPQISKDKFLHQMNENLTNNDNDNNNNKLNSGNNIPQFVPVVLVPNTSLPIFPNPSFSINSQSEQPSSNDVHILNWTIPFNPAITNALNNLNVNYHKTTNLNESTQEIQQKSTENSLINSINSQINPLPSHNYFMNLSNQHVAQNNTNISNNNNKNINESQISTLQSSLNDTYSMMSSNQIPTIQSKKELLAKTFSVPTDKIISHGNSIDMEATSKSMDETLLTYNFNTSEILTQSSVLTTEKDSNVNTYSTPGIKPKSTTTDVYYNFWEPLSPMRNEQTLNTSSTINNNNNKTKNNINMNNYIGDSEIKPKNYIKNLIQNLKKYLIDSCIIMSMSEIKEIIDEELEQLISETTNICNINNTISENTNNTVVEEISESEPTPVILSITINEQSDNLINDDEVITCTTDNLDTDRNFTITLDECYDEQNISLQSLDENLSCITYITACHAYKNTNSNDTVSRYEPLPQFRQIKPYQRVEKNFTLPIIKTATELNIPRSPIICPITSCQKLTFVSDFSKHMKIDHVQIPIESMTPGKCKNLFLDPKIDNYGVNKCQMLYLVTDKLRDLGSSKYKDYLPLLVMTKRVNIEELLEIKLQQTTNAAKANYNYSNNENFLMIWLTGLCPPEMDLYFTLTAWSRVDTIYNRLVHSGKVYSLRQSQESVHLYNSGQVMLISDEQCNCLTDNGKNLIALQVVVY